MARFAFRFDPKYARLLGLVNINPETAFVDVDGDRLIARFGPWRLETSRNNITEAHIEGPYKAHRVIGPHLSGGDKGLTFGSNAESGVWITFAEPVPGLEPTRRLKHPNLTVTVADPEALVAALSSTNA